MKSEHYQQSGGKSTRLPLCSLALTSLDPKHKRLFNFSFELLAFHGPTKAVIQRIVQTELNTERILLMRAISVLLFS